MGNLNAVVTSIANMIFVSPFAVMAKEKIHNDISKKDFLKLYLVQLQSDTESKI